MTLLVLYTLRTYMDATGYCYPSQEQIAKTSGISVRTVQNKLPKASRLHWVGMTTHARAGQQWKSYAYTSCIPDLIELGSYEQMVCGFEGNHGTVEPEALTGGLGKAKAPARRAGTAGVQRSATRKQREKDPQVTAEGPASDREKHPHDVRTNSDRRSFQGSVLREGVALSRNTDVTKFSEEKLRESVHKLSKEGCTLETILKVLSGRADAERIRQAVAEAQGEVPR
jgi:hypothetical protein